MVSLERVNIVEYDFFMIPTVEIGFGGHVALVSKVIDFFRNIS